MPCSKETNVVCHSEVKFILYMCPPGSAYIINSYTPRYMGFAAPVLPVRAVNPTDLAYSTYIRYVQVFMQWVYWKVHTDFFEEILSRNMGALAYLL